MMKRILTDIEHTSGVIMTFLCCYGIVLLVAIYLFLYIGAEASYRSWISTYAYKVYEMTEDDAAYLTSMFWLAITAGRALAGKLITSHPLIHVVLYSLCWKVMKL
jgi:fucose permease